MDGPPYISAMERLDVSELRFNGDACGFEKSARRERLVTGLG